MSNNLSLREVVAPLMRMRPEDLTVETSVTQFNNSLERTKLGIGLKRVGMSLPTGKLGPRFADLEMQLGMAGSAHAAPVKITGVQSRQLVQQSGPAEGLHLGIDIESIESLPVVSDPWEDEFYTGTFTASEIAYALLQDDPRTHLAGAWCAKEALRKSGSAWIDLPWQSIELGHKDDGAPLLKVLDGGEWQALPCAVSVSHTSAIAIAVVAWSTRPTDLPHAIVEQPAAPATVASAPVESGGSLRKYLPLAISLLALALSFYAIVKK